MHAPRLSALLPLLAPAQPAANRGCVNKSLSYFIPPLLLRAGPHFFLATINTTKRPIDIIPAINKIRRAVTVVRRQQRLVHRRTQHGTKPEFLSFVAGLNLGAFLFSFGLNLSTFLFAAFHFHLAGSIL